MTVVASVMTYSLLSEMAPDAWLDELLRLGEAAREIPGARGAKSVSPSALFRKIQASKLRAVKCGRTLMTTRRWLRDMLLAEMTSYRAERGIEATSSPRSKSAGDRAAEQAAARAQLLIGRKRMDGDR